MKEISADIVKRLRERTSAGIMECKRALQEVEGNIEKAETKLREKGLLKARSKLARTTTQGVIWAYVHPGNQVGTLIELKCESDFVGRNDKFQALAKEIAMHITAVNPLYVRREDVPEDELERERDIYRVQVRESGKPEKVIDKIVKGKIDKYLAEIVLLEQEFVRDPSKTVQRVIEEAIAMLGENIAVARFSRFKLGEDGEEAGGS